MKSDMGGFMQNHIEKLVLGFAVIVLLAFAGYFLLGSPYSGGDEAIAQLQQEIVRLDGKLRNDQLPETTVPQWGDFFVERSQRDIVELARFDIPLGMPGIGRDLIGDRDATSPEVEYSVPNVPVAERVIVRSGRAMVSPESVSGLDTNGSGDVRYVSVGATIDLQKWIDRLQEGPRVRQIPERLWRGLFGIAGVSLQRQQYDAETGTWLEPTVVGPLPEQLAFLPPQWGGESIQFTDDSAMEAIQVIRANQDAIARPAFPEQIGGLPWLPPDSDQMTLTPDQHDQLHRIRTQITDITGRIQRIQQRLGDTPEGASIGGPQAGTPQRDTAANQELRNSLNELLQERDNLIADRNQLMGISTDTGYRSNVIDHQGWHDDDMGMRPQAARLGQQPPRQQQAGARGETEDMRINVWAHDLTVEPGQTYRYRVVVTLMNPLFRNANLSDAQRAANFNQIALGPNESELAASSWSDPVSVDPVHHLFLVHVSGDGRSGRFQVWTVNNGRWQTTEFDHTRGDPVGGTQAVNTSAGRVTINFAVGQLLVDFISEVSSGSRPSSRGALLADLESGDMAAIMLVDEQNDELIRRLKAEAELEEGYLSASPTSAYQN